MWNNKRPNLDSNKNNANQHTPQQISTFVLCAHQNVDIVESNHILKIIIIKIRFFQFRLCWVVYCFNLTMKEWTHFLFCFHILNFECGNYFHDISAQNTKLTHIHVDFFSAISCLISSLKWFHGLCRSHSKSCFLLFYIIT